jgi:hypothetical protein
MQGFSFFYIQNIHTFLVIQTTNYFSYMHTFLFIQSTNYFSSNTFLGASVRVVMNPVLLLIAAVVLLISIFCNCAAVRLFAIVSGFDDVHKRLAYAVYRVFSLSKKGIADVFAVAVLFIEESKSA